MGNTGSRIPPTVSIATSEVTRVRESKEGAGEEAGVEGGLPGESKDRRGIHGTYLVGGEGPAARGIFNSTVNVRLLSLLLLTTGSSLARCKDACVFIHSVSSQQMVCLLLIGPSANYCLRRSREANASSQQNLRGYGGSPVEHVPSFVVIKVGQHLMAIQGRWGAFHPKQRGLPKPRRYGKRLWP